MQRPIPHPSPSRSEARHITTPDGSYRLVVEQIGDDVYLARNSGWVTPDALIARRHLLQPTLSERDSDDPIYLIESLEEVAGVSLPSGGDFASWLPSELGHLALVVAYGVSRATRPLLRVSRLFAPDQTQLETADDYEAAMQLIRQRQTGTPLDKCPVSGLPIYRHEDWRYDSPTGEFSFTLEQLGDAFFLGRSTGAPTAEDLEARLALAQQVFERRPSDQPLYLLEDLSQVEKLPRHLNRAQSLWFPETTAALALVVPFALNRSMRASARVGQLLTDTAVTVKFKASYNEAINLALLHRSGKVDEIESGGTLPLSQVRALVAQIKASSEAAAAVQPPPAKTEIALGDMVGRYEVKTVLGHGGMAIVYLAHDTAFQREVALKALSHSALQDATFLARFERESRIIASLEHNAIVPVYDRGNYGGQPYLVMRYMTGGVLGAQLQERPLPLPIVQQIIARLASALDYAHSRGIIHRDLKPANIFFDQFGEAYLADFGIARIQNDETISLGDGSVGTPAYMSPEQIVGQENIDHRADIYSLGVLLFEMLTGRLPFADKSPVAVAMGHLSSPPPPLHSLNPNLPLACQMIIDRAMAKAPDGRYDLAGQLSDDLSAV